MSPSDRRTFLKSAAGAAAALAIQPELGATPFHVAAPLGVAVIGTGRQGRAILGELAKFKDVTVRAICDVDASRLRSAARRAPEAKRFDDHAKLLGDGGIDAVFVATPTHAHRSVAIAAVEAKKHVYCEGPLAHAIDDGRAIARAARSSSKTFQTGMQGRSNPIYKLARSFVRSGAIRDLVAMQAHYHRKTSWRTPANNAARAKALNWKLDPELSLGLLGEVGTHQFDVIHWFTGKYPSAVRASGAVLAWQDDREVADTVHAELSFAEGLRLAYGATLGNSFESTYELFSGTMGTVKLAWTAGWMFKEADAPTQGWEVYANRQQFHDEEGITLIADATKLASQGKLKEGVGLPHPPLYYAIEDFLKSATEQKPVVCTAEEGLRAAVVAIKSAEALNSGAPVTIDPELFKV